MISTWLVLIYGLNYAKTRVTHMCRFAPASRFRSVLSSLLLPLRQIQARKVLGESVALLVARRTNDRKVVGSRPTKVMCITVSTGNRLGWTVCCGRPLLLLPSCRKLEFRLSALMDSDLAWVNGKSGRQSWCYADAFQRSIISGAIYHLSKYLCYKAAASEQMNESLQAVASQSWCIAPRSIILLRYSLVDSH